MPDRYPHEPPKCRLQTTGSNTVRFGPNLYSALAATALAAFDACASCSSSLMCEKPYHLEPGFEETSMRGSDPRDVKNYSDCITHETLRVAVVMMVREGPQHMLMSPMLRSVVRYEDVHSAALHYVYTYIAIVCDQLYMHAMTTIEQLTHPYYTASIILQLYSNFQIVAIPLRLSVACRTVWRSCCYLLVFLLCHAKSQQTYTVSTAAPNNVTWQHCIQRLLTRCVSNTSTTATATANAAAAAMHCGGIAISIRIEWMQLFNKLKKLLVIAHYKTQDL
eukprot:7818-Heterococcus_DN1.PRE.2